MSTVLLYRRSTCVTGRALARELGIPRSHYGMGEGRPTRSAMIEAETLIRWGNSTPWPNAAEGTTINSGAAIAVSGDKVRTFEALNAAGLPTPQWTVDRDVAQGWLDEDAIVFGRERHGQGGRDITIYRPGSTGIPQGDEFYSRVISVRREYRIHVVSGDVIRVQGRYLDHPDLAGDRLVRSHSNGWRFRAPRQNINSGRELIAIEALTAVGLKFGAVDLAINEDGESILFEVNAAPGCSPLTRSSYVNAFRAQGWAP